jgi:hypothetical protein
MRGARATPNMRDKCKVKLKAINFNWNKDPWEPELFATPISINPTDEDFTNHKDLLQKKFLPGWYPSIITKEKRKRAWQGFFKTGYPLKKRTLIKNKKVVQNGHFVI